MSNSTEEIAVVLCDSWPTCSLGFNPLLLDPISIRLYYFLIVLCGVILMHSAHVHGNKINSVRIYNDIAAFLGILSGIFVLVALDKPEDLVRWAVDYDFWFSGFCLLGIQLCDNMLFLDRFRAVTTVPTWKLCLIYCWIWTVQVATWLPAYTIVPFFYDTNSLEFAYVFGISTLINTWGSIAYNFYFTFEFSRLLLSSTVITFSVDDNNKIIRKWSRLEIIAIKSIGHCITSSVATLSYYYGQYKGYSLYYYGFPTYPIIIVFGLHFWFNYKIERICLDSTSFPGTSTGNFLWKNRKSRVNPWSKSAIESSISSP
jgi:hypothetical protein